VVGSHILLFMQQSALDPAGEGAGDLARLFWWSAIGAVIIWAAVVALLFIAWRAKPEDGQRWAMKLVVIGGAVVPTIVLGVLLVYGLRLVPKLLAPVRADALRIAVTGEQFWWRVRYIPHGRQPVELANEIRLPVNEPVEFLLDSPDVIHAFWIPSLGGKMDMIPGRTTRLVLKPQRTGTFRGQCAEYCGTSHALMAFPVVVMEREEFDRWLAHQYRPARAANGERFFANGCPACHTIKGTSARGVIGPDLTHVGSRLTLGAGIVSNEPDAFMRWIEKTNRLKPGVHMPSFTMLPPAELQALSRYLESLD
jgi:cytochrome c oxidase subunit 2